MIMRHNDEEYEGLYKGTHFHWHFFYLKKPGQAFDLHPGFLARNKFNITRKEM